MIAAIATQMITGTEHAEALWAHALTSSGPIPGQDRIELPATLQIPTARDMVRQGRPGLEPRGNVEK
ncbi:hypothetical protein ACU18_13965 [Arthrobacter sp. ZBG10]|nr:hypothetical protein ACU18_13965 [Arthrobacter sp. ZBG10]